jgi:uncharacterized SAM-binding protein YcdF (DUF218 family)
MMRVVRVAVLIGASLAAAGFLFHNAVLGAVGGYLVREQAPEKADIAIVLGGDGSGRRILKAGELVREGYVPQVLVSGPGGAYGLHECDLAIAFAVKAGYPESYFRHMEHDGHSTRDEAQVAAPILRQLHVHTALLVTSDFHTRRAGDVFRNVTPDISYIVVGATDEYFSAGGWWRDREARKITLLEWTKTVANWFKL